MTNQYPLWKYLLLVAIVLFGVVYALPNLYGEVPAIQVSSAERSVVVDEAVVTKATDALKQANVAITSVRQQQDSLFVVLPDVDTQAKADEVVKTALGDSYTVALSLLPTTPAALSALGANAMRLGLDLRGGIHFLLAVDVDSVFQHQSEGDLRNIAKLLREQRLRYSGVASLHQEDAQGVVVSFRDESVMKEAYKVVNREFPNYQWKESGLRLEGSLGDAQYQQIRQSTMDQSMTILRNRVNELGISEAVVSQQGSDEISIDLPGIQDPAAAQNIIGKTATLEFHLVDVEGNASQAAATGVVPANDVLIFDERNVPYLLDKEIILGGASITNASSNFGDQGAEVSLRLAGGAAVSNFSKVTMNNIGKPLSVVYVETKPITKVVGGEPVTTYKTTKRLINIATINSALGNSFRITGLSGVQEAASLALLLRAGALPVPIHIVQARTIGPSLGMQNIRQGMLSVEIGFAVVVFFMLLYYRLFGLFANCALGLNLLLIVAVMSLMGAVMTLPGIAGIVLTVGMAVDANVLIFERIREELRNGVSVQAAIHLGYGRALTTIVDANVTTLIVAIVLFSLGSGPVKGFAVTLTIGLITSMITAIFGTRALVNLVYGQRDVKYLSIGVRHQADYRHLDAANG